MTEYNKIEQKTDKKLYFEGVSYYYLKDNYKIKFFSKKTMLDLSKEFLSFPYSTGELRLKKKRYSLKIGNGKIFLNDSGVLKGDIVIRSYDPTDKFMVKGRDFYLDFENNIVLSYNPIYVRLRNIAFKGGNIKIDFVKKRLYVANGVKGEIYNFNP